MKKVRKKPSLKFDESTFRKQILNIKEKHKDCIVWFEYNDFYETIDNDAEITANLLGTHLIDRKRLYKVTGFHKDKLEGYLKIMIKNGHRIALVNQV